jgi:hypothetical protein
MKNLKPVNELSTTLNKNSFKNLGRQRYSFGSQARKEKPVTWMPMRIAPPGCSVFKVTYIIVPRRSRVAVLPQHITRRQDGGDDEKDRDNLRESSILVLHRT